MRTIEVEGQQVNLYTIDDFPYDYFYENNKILGTGKRIYNSIFCTFDIETTTLLKENHNELDYDIGFMYVWKCCINGYVCTGRKWSEYIKFMYLIHAALGNNAFLVTYVHNLGFEFQFMRDFISVDTMFATEERKPLYFTSRLDEYRCSWRLTNKSLESFTQKTSGVTFPKMDGEEYDYDVERYPDTELSDEEEAYGICDVLGLWQGINTLLKVYSDDITTIPLTSTGYVRRDYREVCLSNKSHMNRFHRTELDEHLYLLCREASRGAISGSSHIYTDETLDEVDSRDIKSSYPFNMATGYFPNTPFIKFNCRTYDEKLKKLLDTRCCLIVWSCKNLKLKKYQGIPYISKAKCRAISGASCGNGKVYKAERIGMCCTEIDMKIILNDYYCNDIVIHEIWCAERGMLSKAFRTHLLEMFQMKTDLEGGDEEEYNKYKNKINASFGMMLTDILNDEIILDNNNEWRKNPITNIKNALKEYYNNPKSFLSYQDGVWVLAHGRECLHKGTEITGRDTVQVDTDSTKYIGNHDKEFKKLNKEIIKLDESVDPPAYSIKKDGTKLYLGIWEHEGKDGESTYDRFRTLGAKKYATEKEGKLKLTVAGLNKKAGWYLTEYKNGIDSFTSGTKFPAFAPNGKKVSGRSTLLYHDENRIYHRCIDGHSFIHGSGIAFHPGTYTLGMTDEWYRVVHKNDINEDDVELNNGQFKGWV